MSTERRGFGRHQENHFWCDGCHGEIVQGDEYLTQKATCDGFRRKHYCVGFGAGPDTCDPATGDTIPCAHREGQYWVIRQEMPGLTLRWVTREVPATEWVKRRRVDPDLRRTRTGGVRGLSELLRIGPSRRPRKKKRTS